MREVEEKEKEEKNELGEIFKYLVVSYQKMNLTKCIVADLSSV